MHGPYADWREAFTAAANREGAAIDDAFAARFGLTLQQICRVAERFFPHRRAGNRARAGARSLAAAAGWRR